MSPFEPRMIHDVKPSSPAPDYKDVEGVSLPSYPLNEPEVLVVGHGDRTQRLIHWFRARRLRRRGCCSHADGCRKSAGARIVRVIALLFVFFTIIGLVRLTMLGITTRKAYKSLKCIAINPSELSDGSLSVAIPFCQSKGLIVHPSLSAGNSHIMHDETLSNGTVQVDVTFGNATVPGAVYDGCVTKFWGRTVLGLIPREGKRAEISSFTIRIPTPLSSLSVKFLGNGDKKISDKKLMKIVKWWRKQQDKKKCDKKRTKSAA